MKKLVIFLLFAAPFVMDAQMTYVPDDNFEQALIDLGYDTPPLNDSVPTKNISTVTILFIPELNISDLTGIEDFFSLGELYCYANQLTSLDVSKNTNLFILSCDSNKLTSLDVTKNQSLEALKFNNNKLTNLDVSKNSALYWLECMFNQLTSLDISNNPNLEVLWCDGNQLTSLDVSKNSALDIFSCEYNKLMNLDVSKNYDLGQFWCSYNQMKTLDLNNNPLLTRLYCSNNQFTSMNVGKCKDLEEFFCSNNNLTSLDISLNYRLDAFDARVNPDLYCIQVKDSSIAANNPNWKKDSWADYSTDCGYTAINDFKFGNKSVSVIPNPAQDFIEIELGNNHTLKGVVDDVKIYNFLGEIVSGLDTPPNPLFLEGGKCRIDVSGLVPGVYFVRFGDSVQRFVKY